MSIRCQVHLNSVHKQRHRKECMIYVDEHRRTICTLNNPARSCSDSLVTRVCSFRWCVCSDRKLRTRRSFMVVPQTYSTTITERPLRSGCGSRCDVIIPPLKLHITDAPPSPAFNLVSRAIIHHASILSSAVSVVRVTTHVLYVWMQSPLDDTSYRATAGSC